MPAKLGRPGARAAAPLHRLVQGQGPRQEGLYLVEGESQEHLRRGESIDQERDRGCCCNDAVAPPTPTPPPGNAAAWKLLRLLHPHQGKSSPQHTTHNTRHQTSPSHHSHHLTVASPTTCLQVPADHPGYNPKGPKMMNHEYKGRLKVQCNQDGKWEVEEWPTPEDPNPEPWTCGPKHWCGLHAHAVVMCMGLHVRLEMQKLQCHTFNMNMTCRPLTLPNPCVYSPSVLIQHRRVDCLTQTLKERTRYQGTDTTKYAYATPIAAALLYVWAMGSLVAHAYSDELKENKEDSTHLKKHLDALLEKFKVRVVDGLYM